MSERRRVFMDMEFTGLHQRTAIVSIGIVSDRGDTFYAEVSDIRPESFKTEEDLAFFKEHILPNLLGAEGTADMFDDMDDDLEHIGLYGPQDLVKISLGHWLGVVAGDRKIEVWADVLAYDWVLFNEVFGHAFKIPDCVYYIPFDLATLLEVKGYDPDVNREEFAGLEGDQPKHNALHDAKVVKLCWQKASTRGLVWDISHAGGALEDICVVVTSDIDPEDPPRMHDMAAGVLRRMLESDHTSHRPPGWCKSPWEQELWRKYLAGELDACGGTRRHPIPNVEVPEYKNLRRPIPLPKKDGES